MVGLPPVSLFSLSPTMALGYGLVIGVGAVCIGAGFLERKLFGGSHAYISDWVGRIVSIALPLAYIAIIWRLFSAL